MNSKKKGSRFELKMSKWFTKWTAYTWNRVLLLILLV